MDNDNPFSNITVRLRPEQILETDENDTDLFQRLLELDLQCLGSEPSEEQLIIDEVWRNRPKGDV